MAFPCWWQPWCALRVFLLVSFRFHAKSPSFLCCFGSCPVADAEPLLEVGSLSACGASVLCLSNRQLLCRMSHDIGRGRQHEQQSTTFEDLLLKQQLQQQKIQQSTKTSNSKQATVTKQQARTLMMAGKDKPQRRQRQTTTKNANDNNVSTVRRILQKIFCWNQPMHNNQPLLQRKAVGCWCVTHGCTDVILDQSVIGVFGTNLQDPTYSPTPVESLVHGLEYGAVKVKSTKSARTPDS